jgi:hypothetical protein
VVAQILHYEKVDLLEYSHDILNDWKNHFSHLLNVNNVSDVRKREVHTAGPIMPGANHLEDEIATTKMKSINCHVVVRAMNGVE